ncbi:acyl carrier protein [Streptomyces apocyni]|uniref:acyl carrier protein n=1 Tax=Streptomyces apocyni TaxID=2654677 RepID=UPI0012E9A37B|nr:acyl carrier protein [Streptomyces apocyni]
MTTTSTTASTSTPTPTSTATAPEAGSASALTTVRAELLNCFQTSLSVLADHHHGPDTHLALGAALRFRPAVSGASRGLPTVGPPVDDVLGEAGRLGLVESGRWQDVPAGRLCELAERHGPLYVIADGYDMPWLPYHRQRHIDHGWLVEPGANGRAAVVDAYHNHTPWGLARPGRWEYGWDELPSASLVVSLTPLAEAPRVLPSAEHDPYEPFVAAYAEHPDRQAALDQLTMETWFLARSRRLHAAFLAQRSGSPAPPEVSEHLGQLDRLAEQTFLTQRRVQRGRPEPKRLFDDVAAVLKADRQVFGGAGDDPLRESVAEVVASVLGADPATVLAGTELSELPGFDSFKVVDIVDSLELRLGIEFDPEDLLPENLHQIDALCLLITTSSQPRAVPR